MADAGPPPGAAPAVQAGEDRLKYWETPWSMGVTPWHAKDVSAHLIRFMDQLVPPSDRKPETRVLVPLCGKTVDMAFLARQGLQVVGLEGVAQAITEFAAEQGASGKAEPAEVPKVLQERGISAHTVAIPEAGAAPPILFLVGDFFKVDAETAGQFDAAVDRGSFEAISPEERDQYARSMAGFMKPGARVLFTASEHDEFTARPEGLGKLGPPFSMPLEVVQKHFGESFDVQQLVREDSMSPDHALAPLGPTYIITCVYLLTRKSAAP